MTTKIYPLSTLGDNSKQTIVINEANVRRVTVEFPKGGAVAELVTCE